jgi:hypothetical protein
MIRTIIKREFLDNILAIPKFEDKKLKLGDRMRDALPYISLLLF